ncbi:MAG: RDD family protein [Spirochaetia bacterium]|nr:RDD family protein [Spirochaetia bacterium]
MKYIFNRYHTIGARIFSGLFDGIIYISLSVIIQFILLWYRHPISFLIELTLNILIIYIYIIIMTAKFGGTLGKLFFNLNVVVCDSEIYISCLQSFKREILNIVAVLPRLIATAAIFFDYSREKFLAIAYPELTNFWFILDLIVTVFLLTSEVGTALLNSKRRALHDFIAGTIVVRIAPYRPFSRSAVIILLIIFFTVFIYYDVSSQFTQMIKSVA